MNSELTRDSGLLALGGIASKGGGERLRFALLSLPISVNRLYTIDHNRRRVFLSDEALLWKTHVGPSILPCRLDYETYKLTLSYQSPRWLVKSGNLRKVDHSNWDKIVIDTLCAKWQWDDSRLVEVVRRKEWYEYDRIVVTLEEGHRLEACNG